MVYTTYRITSVISVSFSGLIKSLVLLLEISIFVNHLPEFHSVAELLVPLSSEFVILNFVVGFAIVWVVPLDTPLADCMQELFERKISETIVLIYVCLPVLISF